MTSVRSSFAAVLIAGSVAVASAAAQDPPQTAAPQKATAQPQVAIIGCVERTLPATTDPARTAQQATPARAYKLIDTQPGGGSPVTDSTGRVLSTPAAKAPEVVEPQYWLAESTDLDFAKYQNQRVEIVGTLSAAQKPATPVTETPPPDAPKSTLTAHSVRVISTECKGRGQD